MKIEFIVPGEPCAQGRPRFTTIGGYARAYDPAKSRNYKAFVKMVAMGAMPACSWGYTERPIKIHIVAMLEVAKSKSKKYRAAALAGTEKPTKKPDVDNIFKTVTDALSGIVYKDDKQIVEAIITKVFKEEPGVYVAIETID